MILETITAYLKRLSDHVYPGRNRARIVIGTDRKDTKDSGYGDGGENDSDSAAIDLVAGFAGDSGDPSFENDASRVYLSGKSDPDDYIGNSTVGRAVTAEPAILQISDNIYLKARKKTKIVGPSYSVSFDDNGDCSIISNNSIEIKVGSNIVRITTSGIELDAGQGPAGKIITHLDSCVGIDPVTGSPIISNFVHPAATVLNSKVFVK